MGNITKNQHYVPRVLLKHFTAQDDDVISIYDSTRKFLRPPSKITKIFSENYFYDTDNEIENFLDKYIEGPASSVIEEIVMNPYQKIKPISRDLIRFVSVQLCRTPEAQEDALRFVNAFWNSLVKRLGKYNGINMEDAGIVKVLPNNPKALQGKLIQDGLGAASLIRDLNGHILINNTDLPFIISDHPVVHYNWFLRESNDCRYTSLTSCGLQIFIPLSKSITYCLYDDNIYEWGEGADSCTTVIQKSDVELLNDLQILNRKSMIAFSKESLAGYIIKRCEVLSAESLHLNHASSFEDESMENGRKKTTHVTWRTQAPISCWFSICKIRNRALRKEGQYYDRQAHKEESRQ